VFRRARFRAQSVVARKCRGKPYAARFEVWFKPDDGSPARKLAGRILMIEGWLR